MKKISDASYGTDPGATVAAAPLWAVNARFGTGRRL